MSDENLKILRRFAQDVAKILNFDGNALELSLMRDEIEQHVSERVVLERELQEEMARRVAAEHMLEGPPPWEILEALDEITEHLRPGHVSWCLGKLRDLRAKIEGAA